MNTGLYIMRTCKHQSIHRYIVTHESIKSSPKSKIWRPNLSDSHSCVFILNFWIQKWGNCTSLSHSFCTINSFLNQKWDPRVLRKSQRAGTSHNWDGQTLYCFNPWRVLYNKRYAVKYSFFAQFLTQRGAQTSLIY
jgi:hypothetical protein